MSAVKSLELAGDEAVYHTQAFDCSVRHNKMMDMMDFVLEAIAGSELERYRQVFTRIRRMPQSFSRSRKG
jgi:hypothetical protein